MNDERRRKHLHAFLSAFVIRRSDVLSSTASKFVIKKNAAHRIDIGSLWQFGQ